MKPSEPHLGTSYIAWICSALGWATWGAIAIPGVMIAHAIKSTEPATALAAKAALRVGDIAILVGLARAIILFPTFLVIFARMKDALGFGDVTDFDRPLTMESTYLQKVATD